MITATIFTKGKNRFLTWSFNTEDEEKILRKLLKGTNTRVGYKISHFTTLIRRS